MKKLFFQMRTMIADCFAYHAHKKKAAGEWLHKNYAPGSFGYESGDVCLALGGLYNELALAIKGTT